MATDEPTAGALDLGGVDRWGFESPRPLAVRIPRNLWRFALRKPLGAFGGVLVLMLLTIAVFGPGVRVGPLHVPALAPYGPNEYELGKHKLEGSSLSHPFGTDQQGRDVLSRLFHGARISFSIGLGVFFISTTMSTTLTLVSAFYIRSVDLILQRLIEIFGFLPDLIIIIALFAIYGASPLTLTLTLGVLGGINTSRILRSVIIGVRTQPFIESARSMGASDKRLIFRHILPNVAFLIIVGATGAIAAAVTAEAGLAIIGFGLDPSKPSWGNMINASREFLRVAPHMALFPGLMIFLTLFGFRLLGDAMRDVLDPRLRGSR